MKEQETHYERRRVINRRLDIRMDTSHCIARR